MPQRDTNRRAKSQRSYNLSVFSKIKIKNTVGYTLAKPKLNLKYWIQKSGIYPAWPGTDSSSIVLQQTKKNLVQKVKGLPEANPREASCQYDTVLFYSEPGGPTMIYN